MTPPLLLAAREGFEVHGTESFFGPPIVELSLFGIDLSINRTVVILYAAVIITATMFAIGFRDPKLVPRGMQNVMEYGVVFVRDQITLPTIGPKGLPFLPFLTTLFFFIFFCNIFEVVPGINFPATARFGVPLAVAIIAVGVAIGAGIKAQGGLHYLHSALIPPDVPWPLLFIITPVEFATVFILRPFSLAVRVMANMIAGHLLLSVFFLGTAYLLGRGMTAPWAVLSIAMSTVLVGFEVFVAALQAFIFTILTAVYIAGSIDPAH